MRDIIESLDGIYSAKITANEILLKHIDAAIEEIKREVGFTPSGIDIQMAEYTAISDAARRFALESVDCEFDLYRLRVT